MEPTLDFQSTTAPFFSTSLSTSVIVIIPATSSPSSTQSQSQSVGGGDGGSDMSLATPLAPEFVFSGLLVVSLAGLWWRQRRVRRAGDVQVEEERRREERRRNARLGARPRLLDARVETVETVDSGETGRRGWRWGWRDVMPISAAYTRSLSISPLNAVDASSSLPSESDIRRRSAGVSRISLRSNSRTVEDPAPETPVRTPPPTPPPTPIPRLHVAVLISMPHPHPRPLSHTTLQRHSNNNTGQHGSGSFRAPGEAESGRSGVRLNEIEVDIPVPLSSISDTRIHEGLGNLDVSLEIGVSDVDVFEG